MAPRSLVLAAWIPTKFAATIGSNIFLSNDYNMESGTSMGYPHVAVVVALLKGAHPEWTQAGIRSTMMTTANPLDNTNNPIRDSGLNLTFASPLAMGSGHIDPNRAQSGLSEYVVLHELHKEQIFTITRSHRYNCSNPLPDLNNPSFIALYSNNSATTIQTFQRTLTSVGDGVATYNAEVIAPRGSKVTVSPKMLIFNQKYNQKSYTLRIKYKSGVNEATSGSLAWIEANGVRSPIVPYLEVTI
ncbi:hypothetical protein ACSBR2_040523 [Camellia fascicularis]